VSDDDLDSFRDPDLVNLQDYDAVPEDVDDPATVHLGENDGPNRGEGGELDTGAAIR
jgi:hypothetical protein